MNRDTKRHQAREERRTQGQDTPAALDQRPEARPTRSRTAPGQFLREVRGELRKVAWPNRQEVTSYTLVVLVTTAVLSAMVFGMDWVINRAVITIFG